MKDKTGWHRKIMRYVPIAAAVASMTLIFASVTFFFEHDRAKIAAATVGLLVLLAGIWFAGNPFLANERKDLPRRTELNRFIDLVRKLNRSAISDGAEETIEQVKSQMHEAVERGQWTAGSDDAETSRRT